MTITTMEAPRWSTIIMEVFTSLHPIHPELTGSTHPTTGILTSIPGMIPIIHTALASTWGWDMAGDGEIPTMDTDTLITVLLTVTGIIPIMDTVMVMEAPTGGVIVTDTTMPITGAAEDIILLIIAQDIQTMGGHQPTGIEIPVQAIRPTV